MRADRGQPGESARPPDPDPGDGQVMPTHGDRITMIRHMVLLGALGAGAFGGRQRGDGFQLRLVLERGNPPSPTANHALCVGVSQPTTPPSHDFGYLRIRSRACYSA